MSSLPAARAASMRVPPPAADEPMDPDMSIARTTSRAFIFRVTSASAVTVMVSKPNTRMKLVGMVAPAVSVMVSVSSSTVTCGPLTVAPM